MQTTQKTITITGKLEKDIFGTWDDVTQGIFVDREWLTSILWKFLGKNVTITITETPEQEI